MARIEFSSDVRLALRERVASRCSFPGCGVVTTGPSAEGPTAVARTGMACHIAAASGGPGARRVVADMSPAEISSYDNGIGLCYRHGRLVDADEVSFTISMLKSWRTTAENYAAMMQRIGADPFR